jgi:hypothetical protein
VAAEVPRCIAGSRYARDRVGDVRRLFGAIGRLDDTVPFLPGLLLLGFFVLFWDFRMFESDFLAATF